MNDIDAIYTERNALVLGFAALAYERGWQVGWAGPDPAWPVLIIDTPAGQMSWHLPAGEAAPHRKRFAADVAWDGHTTPEKYGRLAELVAASGPTMQAKDLDNAEVLALVEEAIADHAREWGRATWTNTSAVAAKLPYAPFNVVAAKLRKLWNRDLLDGCPCGCRGDWHLTDKGRAFLAAAGGPS